MFCSKCTDISKPQGRPIIVNPFAAFSEEEIDTLQEIMNMAFGSAAADLAEAMDVHVILSVPTIRVLQTSELSDYVKNEIRGYERISIVEQDFLAKFRGIALLIFPSGLGRSLFAILGEPSESSFESDPMDALERETLMEIANILVGACVSKVAELLGDVVIYSPPRVVVEDLPQNSVSEKLFQSGRVAITLQTVFHFNAQDVSGFLFLVCDQESTNWLRKALDEFLKQYE
jgi:chemotaxis protein CheC